MSKLIGNEIKAHIDEKLDVLLDELVGLIDIQKGEESLSETQAENLADDINEYLVKYLEGELPEEAYIRYNKRKTAKDKTCQSK